MRFLEHGLADRTLGAYIDEKNSTNGKWSNRALKTLRGAATGMFVQGQAASDESNRELFERMIFRTPYGKPEPRLGLGTLVESGGEYALCIQSLCDSVRLTSATQFPFLMLTVDVDGTPGTNVLVTRDPLDRQRWLTLEVDYSIQALMLDTFTPDGDTSVRTTERDDGGRVFKSESRAYRWIADLRPEYAQHVAEQFGNKFTRVAVDGPELLRLG